jgi:hypothetical protein
VQMLVKDLQLGWVSSGDMMDSVVTIVGNIWLYTWKLLRA